MTGYPTPTFDDLTLTAPLSIANGGTGATAESTARQALGAQASGSDGSNQTTITTATTLTAAQSGTTVLTNGAAAAFALTLPANVAGLNYTIYGNASYAVTVTAPAGSVILPDGTSAASFVLPLSAEDSITVFADGTNWRAFTRGRQVVAAAVNANEAPQWQQTVAGNARTYTAVGKVPNTVYTNSNTYPLFVMASVYSSAPNGNFGVFIGGTQFAESNFFTASTIITFSFIVPPGATYKITVPATASVAFWSEY